MSKVAYKLPTSCASCFDCFGPFPGVRRGWGFGFKILACPKASHSSTKPDAAPPLPGGQYPCQAVSTSVGDSAACMGCSCWPCWARSSPLTVSFQAYLESFYKFCKSLGGTTADAMCPILEVGASLAPALWGSSFLLAGQERRATGLGCLCLGWVTAICNL